MICANPRCWCEFSRSHGNRRYCSLSCQQQAAYERTPRPKRKSARKGPTRGRCVWCKRPLLKRRVDQQYHGRCKKDAENWRRLLRKAKYPRA